MRRKQTSIRFSRSVPTHRYLSWISWVRRPQPSTSWVSTRAAVARATFPRRCPYPRPRSLRPYFCLHLEGKANIFPREKEKTSFFPFRAPLRVALPASSSRVLPATHPQPVCRPSHHLPRPSHKQKMRHCAANPLTAKSVDFSLKKTHVGTRGFHALASAARTYSSTARIHYHSFSFLKRRRKKENRSKFSRFEYIARTHFVRPHDVRDWPPRLVR